MKFFITTVIFLVALQAMAQVEHNFKMSPEKTDCHQLPDLKTISTDSALHVIKSASFRFEQHLTISRYRSPHEVSYYSCNGVNGLMVAKEEENKYAIYQSVPKPTWDSLTNTNDPIGFYNSTSLKRFLLLRPNN